MTEFAYEPFIILEQGGLPTTEAPPFLRRTTFRGHKPGLLLIDRDRVGLDLPLAAEGFEVYRTTDRDSALEMLRAHPSILMALVRMDLPGVDPVGLVRDL